MKTAAHLYHKLQHVIEIVIGCALAVMILVVFAQTFTRYVIFKSIPWSEELSRFLFVGLIALGINIGISKDLMVRIDIIDNKLSPRGLTIVETIRHILGALMNLFFAYSTIALIRIGSIQSSPALQIPMSAIYVLVMAGFILAVLSSVFKIYEIWTEETKEVEN